ncbi:mRNA cleavage factor-like protein, putative [Eimeria mitis]|uniref:mRNA cleavage factor-like protein, putative n=1 Tax=Eimeria mitis TaxID=44415 RepID=U6JT82_9EIME|nr:uncharacterized protein EMH_0036540 [Eimeria mitis]XP_037879099.1 mRNA cleavage factor-like protein, putative [Eimeria mitis]CDJ27976.1 hypothetical protein EMH_0036540 [Eimeria mitis]CDJ36811.1 mRNA cleavage factor-like protein, putative [Eimeria mitis]
MVLALQVQLPHRCSFRIPTGFCLTVVPIFELSCERVGLAISGLSHLLARFSIRLMVPTLDKFEAETSMESKTEQETEGIRAELNDTPARPEGPGVQAGTQPTPHREEDLELLPPELQHLAELEEVD